MKLLSENKLKYPRTYHVPWSKDGDKDDKYLSDLDMSTFEKMDEVVVTEKMDGENTTMGKDYIHARSINSSSHPSRSWVKSKWASISYLIDDAWRICGENLHVRHTIPYDSLESFFYIFSVWDDKNVCLSWDETVELAEIYGFPMVPLLYKGPYDEKFIKSFVADGTSSEGWVIRNSSHFHYSSFKKNVAKYVSPNFVLPHDDWSSGRMEYNNLSEDENRI